MKTAALISGIVAMAFCLLGGILQLAGIPGASVSLLFGVFLFIVFSVLLMIWQLTRTQVTLKKLAAVAGLLTALTLGVGLLGMALHWPVMGLTMVGMVFAAAFIGLFFSSANKAPQTKVFGMFTIIVAVVYFSLGMGWYDAERENREVADKTLKHEAMQERFHQLMAKVNGQFKAHAGDTLHPGADSLYFRSSRMILEIENVQQELINTVNGYAAYEGFYLANPLDYDTPTYLLVGENPANPTGRGKELYGKLKAYRAQLSPQVPLDIDLAFDINGQDWVSANFYHATAIDAVTRLLEMQIKILEAESAAFEKGAFVN